jgi:hypothetical protein
MPTSGAEDTNGGRVTIRELYALILAQNDARYDMERRIMNKLDDVEMCAKETGVQVGVNTKEIENLRARSDRNDWIAGIIAAAAGAMAGIFGGKQ